MNKYNSVFKKINKQAHPEEKMWFANQGRRKVFEEVMDKVWVQIDGKILFGVCTKIDINHNTNIGLSSNVGKQ